MIGKPVAVMMQVPTKRLFPPRQAAEYLGVCKNTLRVLTEEGQIKAYWMRSRLAYRLEELDRYIESLEEYNPARGKNPGPERSRNGQE